MEIESYRPRPMVNTKQTEVPLPRFPVIDAHNHLGTEFGGGWINHPVEEMLDTMHEAGVTHYVDLDGMISEETLYRHLDVLKTKAPDRFRVFGGVNWAAWAEQGDRFGEWAAGRLRIQAARGADGLKVWKPFGLHVRDQHGTLVTLDDPRLSPLWNTAAELKLPVMIHAADPAAFFEPLDESNERWEELHAHPDWQFPSPPFPAFMSIMEAMKRLVQQHPNTTFIGAHVGCCAENLAWVGAMLAECPNYYIDISARTGELGRQPYSARRFFLQYADRILFGLDAGINPKAYAIQYRFLETDDEYFNYSTREIPTQGRWRIYGLYLPDDVLKKVYAENARQLFGF